MSWTTSPSLLLRTPIAFVIGAFLCLPVLADQVYFSPKGGITAIIVDHINNAKTEVLVQAYAFTSTPIIDALCDAKAKGVDVEVIADKSNLQAPKGINTIKACGVSVYIDSAHAIAHNKVIIIDEKITLTGSFNYTKNAETSNAENELISTTPGLALLYRDNWNQHLLHSKVY